MGTPYEFPNFLGRIKEEIDMLSPICDPYPPPLISSSPGGRRQGGGGLSSFAGGPQGHEKSMGKAFG
jgi:hypothetical protein